MVDKKVMSNKNVTVWWVPASGIANYLSPTPAEINAGLNISPAIAWDGFELGASESNDIDDRSIVDAGNAVTAGFQQFSASLSMFRDQYPEDVTSDYVKAWEAFKRDRVPGYLILRVLQAAPNQPAAAGQFISVFRFVTDYTADDTEGEDSVKFTVGFLPQGEVKVNTLVKTATPVTVAPVTLSIAASDIKTITATLSGKSITQGATWVSSNPGVATVSPNGVVKRVSAGTATITANHPAATGPGTVTVTAT